MLLVSGLLVPNEAGHTPAGAEGLEASFAGRASRKDTGWLFVDPAGIPVSGPKACAAARMAALLPVAVAQSAEATPATRGRRARTESAVRVRRNMVAH